LFVERRILDYDGCATLNVKKFVTLAGGCAPEASTLPQQEIELCPRGNLYAALHTPKKTTTNVTKMTDDDMCGKENLLLSNITHYTFLKSDYEVECYVPDYCDCVVIFLISIIKKIKMLHTGKGLLCSLTI
jgi:hypothetical protein